jgi:hypothetical protein
MVRGIEQRISFSDGDIVRSVRDFLNFVSGANFAFRDNSEIEPWLPMRNDQRSDLGITHSNSETITGDTRLRHFKDRRADLVSVPNADFIVGETFNGEILAELSVLEVVAAEFPLPIPIGVDLINHDGTLFTAVACEIALAVAVQIEPSSKHAPGDREFPDSRADCLALPRDFTWNSDIDGQKPRHLFLQRKWLLTAKSPG